MQVGLKDADNGGFKEGRLDSHVLGSESHHRDEGIDVNHGRKGAPSALDLKGADSSGGSGEKQSGARAVTHAAIENLERGNSGAVRDQMSEGKEGVMQQALSMQGLEGSKEDYSQFDGIDLIMQDTMKTKGWNDVF